MSVNKKIISPVHELIEQPSYNLHVILYKLKSKAILGTILRHLFLFCSKDS